jgi:hypothetical protein
MKREPLKDVYQCQYIEFSLASIRVHSRFDFSLFKSAV